MSDKLDRNDSPQSRRRREILTAGSTGALALALGSRAALAEDAAAEGAAAVSVAADGKYERAPLRKDTVRVTAVQSIMRAVRDTANPAREMKANLNHMIDLIDKANGFPGPQDLVCFHEQPIMGWNPWSREEVLRVAIEIPGPETEALGRKAKEYGCYITFGTYAKDPDWPGHLLLNGVLIGPGGNVVANHWKTNNIRGFIPGWDIFTTGIYDVLDRYPRDVRRGRRVAGCAHRYRQYFLHDYAKAAGRDTRPGHEGPGNPPEFVFGGLQPYRGPGHRGAQPAVERGLQPVGLTRAAGLSGVLGFGRHGHLRSARNDRGAGEVGA